MLYLVFVSKFFYNVSLFFAERKSEFRSGRFGLPREQGASDRVRVFQNRPGGRGVEADHIGGVAACVDIAFEVFCVRQIGGLSKVAETSRFFIRFGAE